MSIDTEWEFFRNRSEMGIDFFPFYFFSRQKELSHLEFADITIVCGGNGSGKSTLLNVIAEKLKLKRDTPFNKTDYFDPYVNGFDGRAGCQHNDFLCTMGTEERRTLLKVSRIITSDDVFKSIISVRERNENNNFKRDVIWEEIDNIQSNLVPKVRGFNADDMGSINAYKDFWQKSVGRRSISATM